MFHELTREVIWKSERRRLYEHEVDVPRLVARAPTGGPLFQLLKELSEALSERYRCGLGSLAGGVALAQYRDGADSVVMGGTCQRTWQHSVPKTRAVGPRISVQFRHAYEV